MIITETDKNRKPHQLDLFEQHLLNKSWCTDSLPAGLVIRKKIDAITKRYIQPNGPTHLYWLPFDVDRPTASFDWQDRNAPAPNIVVMNPDNGHAHLLYGLEVPVRKAPDAHLKPLRYAAAIEYAIREKLDADYGYAGFIVKNPLHAHWSVHCPQEAPYSLGWLADYVDLDRIDYRKRPADYGLGRNVTVFNSLRTWAYRAVLQEWRSFEVWHQACKDRAQCYNSFPCPLPDSEIRATAKSVARYTWEHFSKEQFSAIQAYRGKQGGLKSGAARREKMDEKAQMIMTFEGLPSSVVASMTGIPAGTIRRLRASKRDQ
jgi:hypothetical protein